MRSITLKSTGTAWVLAQAGTKHSRIDDVLIVRNVPDNITDAAALHVANATMINTPAKPKEPASVDFARLGAGLLVNLVIGRPEGTTKPEEERKRPRSVSLTDEQAAKFGRLGGSAWLQAQIDAAPEPLH